MSMKIIKVNKGKTFPITIRFSGAILVTMGVIQTMKKIDEPWSILISIGLSTILPALWFTTDIIIIDGEKKELFDGVWVMGFKIGKNKSFHSIKKIFINKVRTKQTMYSLSNKQNIITNHEFQAYLEIDSGEKFFLFSHPIEERAKMKMMKINKALGRR